MSTIFSKIVHKQCLHACNFFRVCWRSLIKRIDGISGLRKCFTENLRRSHFNSGWGCGEALNPWFKRNLHYRLETSAVLFEDNSSSMSGHCSARESVIMRTLTRLAITSTHSNHQFFQQYLLEGVKVLFHPFPFPIFPKPRSCSLSGSCSIEGEMSTDEEGEIVDLPVSSNEVYLAPKDPAVPRPETILKIAC